MSIDLADYLLFIDEILVETVEVKKVGTPLNGVEKRQELNKSFRRFYLHAQNRCTSYNN
jgi:hypothetical protein